jgi:transcriptional regulator with XRE-family HTH domain
MDPSLEKLACELVRGLRGHRSQVAMSRRLGYRSNVLYRWEAGLRWPSGAELLRLAEKTGADVDAALRSFDPSAAEIASAQGAPGTSAHMTAWLRAIRGPGTVSELARRTGSSRSALGRVFSGESEPALPVVLALLAAVDRLWGWLGLWVPLESLPGSELRQRLTAAHAAAALGRPWTDGIAALLSVGQHDPAQIAASLGLQEGEVRQVLLDLERGGVLSWKEGVPTLAITHVRYPDRAVAGAFASFWARQASELTPPAAERAYLVATLPQRVIPALFEACAALLDRARELAHESPDERAVVLVIQTAALDGKPLVSR